ncbi:hypothetical protein RND81_03G002900 [Saponaria officinalis]|uniref:Uncharacterized protein n=1 Tax=Saponaria officinalis TaxID=3572 RepID=A0AAW1M2F3_SAPOF
MVTTRSKQQPQQEAPPTTDRQKWEIIFNALKQLLRKQQFQLDSLSQERNFVQQRLQIQQHAWDSDLFLLHSHISQLQTQLELSKLANLVHIAKSAFFLGSTQRDAFVYKHKLEDTVCELDDFKAWFDILSHRCPDQEDVAPDWLYEILRAKGGKVNSPGAASEQQCKMLEKEVDTLKREYEKLSLKNSSEVSSLRAEIKFAWNQYNEKESTLSNRLQAKNDEINKANEKITALLARLEQLQSLNSEKDQTVSILRESISRLEDEACQKDEMISRCNKELELLKSKRPIGIPTLKRCSAEPSPSSSKRRSSGRNLKRLDLKEGTASADLEPATTTLRDELNKLEAEANLKNGEIARLSKELNLLRSKTSGSTPVLSHRTREPSSSRLKSQVNGSSEGSAVPKEEASQLVSEKVSLSMSYTLSITFIFS